MNKLSLLAASVAIALTGCGGSEGGSSDGSTPPAPGGLIITAVDGLLYNASVWVDADKDLSNGCELDTEIRTNQEGQALISEDYAGLTICVKAEQDTTIDMERGILHGNFDLSATNVKDGSVASPMTHMVVEQMKANSELTQEQAEEKVVAAITKSGLDADSTLIFGNYLTTNSDNAKALKIIGETLVDNSAHSVDTQLAITEELASDVKNQIDNSHSLDNYSPVVTVSNGLPTVESNKRPYVKTNSAIAPIELSLEQEWTEIDAKPFFADDNGDTLTFSLKEVSGQANGLTINPNSGIISGKLQKAGDFDFQVFATDSKNARSYPLSFKLTVTSPNTAPVINETVQAELQAEIDTWQWAEGEQPLDTLNISALFDDADSDPLTYNVEVSLSKNGGVDTGFQARVDGNGDISFDGLVPFAAQAGTENLHVYAKDSVNEDELHVTFVLPAIAEGTTVTPPEQPLDIAQIQDKFLFKADIGGMSTTWCDATYFNSVDSTVYWNVRTATNNHQCPDITGADTIDALVTNGDFEAGPKYSIVNGKIEYSIIDDPNGIHEKIRFTLLETSLYNESLDHFYLDEGNTSMYDLEDGEFHEGYTFYLHGEAVEDEILFHAVTTSVDHPHWGTRMAHYISKDGSVVEFDVSASMQEYNRDTYVDYPERYSSAEIHITGENGISCDEFLALYPLDNIEVSKQDGSYDMFQPHFEKPVEHIGKECYIRLHPNEGRVDHMGSMEPIESGAYTINIEPKDFDKAERILFSFDK